MQSSECTAIDKIRSANLDEKQIDPKKGLPTLMVDRLTGSVMDSVLMPMLTVQLVDSEGAEVNKTRGRAKDEAKLQKSLAKDKDTKAKLNAGEYKLELTPSVVVFAPPKNGVELEEYSLSIFNLEPGVTLKEFQKAHHQYLTAVREKASRFTDPFTGLQRPVYTEGAAPEEKDEMAALGGEVTEATVAGDFVSRTFRVSSEPNAKVGGRGGPPLDTLAELCNFFCSKNDDRRGQGEFGSTPVLLVGETFGGKSVAVQTLAFEIASSCQRYSLEIGGEIDKKGNQPPWQSGLPLVPILFDTTKLLRLLFGRREPNLDVAEDGTPRALSEYIQSDFGSDPARVKLLQAALRLRACVLLFDGFDEAISKGQASELRSFFVNVVANARYRMLVSSRNTQYVDRNASTWPGFVRIDMQPLRPKEQEKVLELQLKQFGGAGTAPWLRHMLAFSECLTEHDKLYERIFEEGERERIEGMASYDRFRHGAKWIPEARVTSINGDGRPVRIVKDLAASPPAASPKSEYFKELHAKVNLATLNAIDDEISERKIRATLPAEGMWTAEHAETVVCAACKDAPSAPAKPEANWFEKAAAPHHKFLKRLVLLLRKRQLVSLSGAHLGAATAKALFHQIVFRCEESYLVHEKYRESASAALLQLINDVPQLQGSVSVGEEVSKSGGGHLKHGPIKDACRLHEKALDEYATRFADGELPEACVTDVLRSQLIINEANKATKGAFAEALYFLSRSKVVNMPGYRVTIECMRRTNKFSRDALDPTHYRTVLLVLRFTFAPLEAKKSSRAPDYIYWEVELQYAPILHKNVALNARDHYVFLRSSVQGCYEATSAAPLDSMLSFLSRMTGNPGPLALFAINLRPRKGGAIKGAAPPSSYVEVLEGAVVSALHWHFCERAGGAGLVTDVENAREMFICLSTSMYEGAKKPPAVGEVAKVLTASAPSGALLLWNRMFDAEERRVPPFLQLTEDDDGGSAVKFVMPQMRECFFLSRLVETCTTSKELQRCLNDPYTMGALRLGGGRFASALCGSMSEWRFSELSLDAFETLCLLLDPDGHYASTTGLAALCLPSELFLGRDLGKDLGRQEPLGDAQYLQYIHCIKKLPHLEKICVDGGRQWISIDQISGFGRRKGADEQQIPGLLSMSSEIQSAVSSRVVSDLATINFSLTTLNLSYNDLGLKGGESIGRLLRVAGGVQRMLLHGCQLGCGGLAAVFRGMRAPPLPSINLAINHQSGKKETAKPSADEMEALSSAMASVLAGTCCPLQLDLTANRLGTVLELPHWESLAQSFSSRLSTLRQLNLSANELSDAIGEALGTALAKNQTLTSLNLNSNRLADRSAKAFAAVVVSPDSQLKTLSLVNNRFGPVGGDDFARALEDVYGEDATAQYESTGMPARTGLLSNSSGDLDLRSNPFASMKWTLLGLRELCPCKIRMNESDMAEYNAALPYARTLNAEQAVLQYGSPRPKSAVAKRPSYRAPPSKPDAAARPQSAPLPPAAAARKVVYSSPQERAWAEDKRLGDSSLVSSIMASQVAARKQLSGTMASFDEWLLSVPSRDGGAHTAARAGRPMSASPFGDMGGAAPAWGETPASRGASPAMGRSGSSPQGTRSSSITVINPASKSSGAHGGLPRMGARPQSAAVTGGNARPSSAARPSSGKRR